MKFPMNLVMKVCYEKLCFAFQTMSECSYLLLAPADVRPGMIIVVTTAMHHRLPLSNQCTVCVNAFTTP